jgi:hypothetical protein
VGFRGSLSGVDFMSFNEMGLAFVAFASLGLFCSINNWLNLEVFFLFLATISFIGLKKHSRALK